jgi:hypothetical protein
VTLWNSLEHAHADLILVMQEGAIQEWKWRRRKPTGAAQHQINFSWGGHKLLRGVA